MCKWLFLVVTFGMSDITNSFLFVMVYGIHRRDLFVGLGSTAAYALGREIVPNIFQPSRSDGQIVQGLVKRLNAYADAKKIPDNDAVTFQNFDGTASRHLFYDRSNGNLQFLRWRPHKSETIHFTQAESPYGHVDKAVNFSYRRATSAPRFTKAPYGLDVKALLDYARTNSVDTKNFPQSAQSELQKNHREDMVVIEGVLERELKSIVSKQF